MNKNQKIALIAGAVALAIVLLISPRFVKIAGNKFPATKDNIHLHREYDIKTALIRGSIVVALTFVAHAVLKSKD
jgi:hypothetical protein|tara:strand:+ start:887 stop:1111 length:225 start_codon:yes stop_codon:yes gene_type:complete